MLARRVIAVSPDKAFAKRLATALMAAGGAAESVQSLDALAKGEIQASLVVVHVTSAAAPAILAETVSRLRKEAWAIAVVDKTDLKEVVACLQVSDRVAGVLVADQTWAHALSAMATRVLFGDIFGLEKLVPWGTKVYSTLVGDYQEKSICIAQISEFAGSLGVRSKYRQQIEQCVDEMLMNALYDAPVDSSGQQLFADVPTKTRISLRMEQKAVVQYACTESSFAVSVRDSFGTLRRDVVLRYLHKCLFSDQQIDRKAGGAGLGLYIMANASSTFLLNELPGVATECICGFDITAPKVQLKEFGFYNEQIDASGRLVAGASRVLPVPGPAFPVERRSASAPPSSRALLWGLGGAIALLLALIVMVAWPRFSVKRGSVAVHTDPPEAIVEIDGRVRGSTHGGELIMKELEVGHAYRLRAYKEGYRDVETLVEPVKGITSVVELRLEAQAATVAIDTDPPGATVVWNDKELGVTPLSVTSLPPGADVTLTLRKTGYRLATRALRVPRPGGEASVSSSLSLSPDFGSLRIESEPPGAQIYQNDELMAGMTTPVAEHIVQAGRDYTFTLRLPGYMPAQVRASVHPGERDVLVKAVLRPGGGLSVRANVDGTVTVVGAKGCTDRPLPMTDCPLANGTYQVRIVGTRPPAAKALTVTIADADVVTVVEFGFVEATANYVLELGVGRTARRLAFDEGAHAVVVRKPDGSDRRELSVRVQPGRTVTVP